MKTEQYNEKIKKLTLKFEEQKRKLMKDYVVSQSSLKVGDVAADHNAIIKIERIDGTLVKDKPVCLYYGSRLKKDLTPGITNAIN